MNLIFWQNILSPHQLPYIKELYKNDKIDTVTLIVPEVLNKERTILGWKIDETDLININVIVDPQDDEITNIYLQSNSDSIHFYSGITAFPFVYNAFKLGLGFSIKRGIISEPPFLFRKPLPLHIVKTLLFDYKYFSKIDYVFAMGDFATKWYSMWHKKWKVCEFAYCTDAPFYKKDFPESKTQFVYVGSLIKRKNVNLLVETIKNIDNFELYIIGDGTERRFLEETIEYYNIKDRVFFLGSMKMEEIHRRFTDFDCLVLPSHFDGWGAVVNEALMAGLYVICSNKCGVKSLIENDNKLGLVFNIKKKDDLKFKLDFVINNINEIRYNKDYRFNWSKKIFGESIAKYFIDCLILNKIITPPWRK